MFDVNFSIHSYVNENEKQEMHFLEIWTNESLTPKEALYYGDSHKYENFIWVFLHLNLLVSDIFIAHKHLYLTYWSTMKHLTL